MSIPATADKGSTHHTPDPESILITGYTGFVGGYLVPQIQSRYPHATLFGLTLALPPQSPGARTPVDSVVPIAGDLLDLESLRAMAARARPDLIFHLAAQSSVSASWQNPTQTLAINAGGAINLFEALRAEGISPRIVLIGSGEQYGLVRPDENPIREDCSPRPANPYAVSKVAQDLFGYQYFVAYGLPILRVRAFNHFGPAQADSFVVSSFAHQIARIEAGLAEPTIYVGNLEAQRDMLPVEDVVRAYTAIGERGDPGAAYNVGSGVARSMRHILDSLLAFANVPIEVRIDPDRFRPVDVPLLVADTTRLRADTGWEPTANFEAALRATLDHWRRQVALER